jgi:hypothetical protein
MTQRIGVAMEPPSLQNLSAFDRLGHRMNDNYPFPSADLFPGALSRFAWPGILALNALLFCASGCLLVALAHWYR